MADYIKRDDFIHLFEAKADMATGTPKAVFHAVCKMVALLPAADVEEVRHGFWIPVMQGRERAWACNECKTLGSPRWKRCPVCEAKMDGGENNENTGNS